MDDESKKEQMVDATESEATNHENLEVREAAEATDGGNHDGGSKVDRGSRGGRGSRGRADAAEGEHEVQRSGRGC